MWYFSAFVAMQKSMGSLNIWASVFSKCTESVSFCMSDKHLQKRRDESARQLQKWTRSFAFESFLAELEPETFVEWRQNLESPRLLDFAFKTNAKRVIWGRSCTLKSMHNLRKTGTNHVYEVVKIIILNNRLAKSRGPFHEPPYRGSSAPCPQCSRWGCVCLNQIHVEVSRTGNFVRPDCEAQIARPKLLQLIADEYASRGSILFATNAICGLPYVT